MFLPIRENPQQETVQVLEPNLRQAKISRFGLLELRYVLSSLGLIAGIPADNDLHDFRDGTLHSSKSTPQYSVSYGFPPLF